MSVHARISRHGTKTKRALGVQQFLKWAFGVEKGQLDLPEPPDPEHGDGFGFGLEHVLLQRATLGYRIDGGRHKIGSYTHEDAAVVDATVGGLPDALGGKRMAIRIAELARAGRDARTRYRNVCRWKPGAIGMTSDRSPSLSVPNGCSHAANGAPSRYWPARSPGDRIRNRSPERTGLTRIGGRNWIGCGMG